MKRSISDVHQAYRDGSLTPQQLCADIRQGIDELNDNPIFIHALTADEQQPFIDALNKQSIDDLPLYGIPFAIKDNIDLAGIPTTAACPDFSYTPTQSAFVVDLFIQAGAIPIGKTNLDQFATGLVGTRSPYGAVKNPINPDYISGGSSSGSAVAVAEGLACFSLGTDTAGSGRVPAALCELIGVKPSRGLLSVQGVVPACLSLDCVSIFTVNNDDAETLLSISAKENTDDPWSRSASETMQRNIKRIGVPSQLEWYGDELAKQAFEQTLSTIRDKGMDIVEIDFTPFSQAAQLLYQGPWVAERYAAIEAFFTRHADRLIDVTQTIIGGAVNHTAVDGFNAMYALQAFKKKADAVLAEVDAILTPTTPSIYTINEVMDNPIQLNTQLGHYTNFMNLLDYSALAIPGARRSDDLPAGVTLFADAFRDNDLLNWSKIILDDASDDEIPEGWMDVVVCGAHMSGLALNHQLLEREGLMIAQTTSSEHYRLYALPGGPPFRPGMIRDEENGAAIDVEVWRLPQKHFGSFMLGIPQPLGIGRVELANGDWKNGFICEGYAAADAKDITSLKSWRAFMATKP